MFSRYSAVIPVIPVWNKCSQLFHSHFTTILDGLAPHFADVLISGRFVCICSATAWWEF